MKEWHRIRRLLTLFLALAVCFSVVPRAVSALNDPINFERITDAAQLQKGGQFVLIASHGTESETAFYAAGNILDRKLTAMPVTEGMDAKELPLWTMEPVGGGFALNNGTAYLTYDTGAYFGASSEPSAWSVTETGADTFRIVNEENNRAIAYNANNGSGRFGPYDLAEIADQRYSFDLIIYRVVKPEQEEPDRTTEATDASEATTVPSEPEDTTAPSQPEETTQPTEPAQPETPTEPPAAENGYFFYFGQLHSHTDISDGKGSAAEAFAYASNVEGLDFLAVTDHSNSFDNAASGALDLDGTAVSQEWKTGKETAVAATDEDFVGLYGFEMTWNNGLGHINTFNTPGWVSRSQSDYANVSTALKNYYSALAGVPQSVSQFNHPGEFYGDFEEFAHYSEEADRVMTLIEVGNGETGDAYAYYIRALDKGWHLAPTNNQNNHYGSWGDSDPGRTVVLAYALSEGHIYDALGNYRVYATEDSDLEILYTLNGNLMGSRLFALDAETADISVSVRDATDSAIGRVEVIVDCGESIAAQTVDTPEHTVNFSVPTGYSYYFIRITQPDGDTAVTAPVWVEKADAVSITRFEADGAVTVAGEAQIFTLELKNQGKEDFSMTSLVVTDRDAEVIYSDTSISVVPGEGTASCGFTHTYETDGIYTLTVTAKGILNGEEKTITRELELTVMPRAIISDVIVDGSHGGIFDADNLIAIAAAAEMKAHVETREITATQLENCTLLVIPAPAVDFEVDFLDLVADYVSGGGNVLLCGTSDTVNNDGAIRVNTLLAAIGSTMTLSDDRVYDPVTNGGEPHILFPETFRADSEWTKGVREGQVYSFRDGCSVNVGSGSWLVTGFDTTFSLDGDGDGLEQNGNTYTETLLNDEDGEKKITWDLVKNAGEICLLAMEETAGGTVFLAGSFFTDDDGMQQSLDNPWDLPYANRTIFENILGITRMQPEITPIWDVRAAEDGRIFLIEGYVTAGTVSPNTTFRDTIYVQDATGGIAVVPYNVSGLALGTKVRITGALQTVEADKQLRILNLTILKERNLITPEALDNQTAMDYVQKGGQLVQVSGEVTEIVLTDDGQGVSRFVIRDGAGVTAVVFVEDYILSGSTGRNTLATIVKVGNRVSAVGLVYRQGETLLRVRDCDEIELLWAPSNEPDPPETGDNPPTGDEMPLGLLLAAMIGSLAAMGFLLGRRKRT